MKKGLHPVALLGVVRRLHKTAGSSAAHFPPKFLSLWNILGLIPCRIIPLALSTCPFVHGWLTAAQSTRISFWSQKLRNFFPVNWVPLSVIMALGTPNGI